MKKKIVTDVERSDFAQDSHTQASSLSPPTGLALNIEGCVLTPHCMLLSTRISTYLHFNCENDSTFPKHPGSYHHPPVIHEETETSAQMTV